MVFLQQSHHIFSSKVNISMLSFAFYPCSIILHMYNSCFFRYAEEQEIQTSLCSARGVMVLTIVTASILHTRWGVHRLFLSLYIGQEICLYLLIHDAECFSWTLCVPKTYTVSQLWVKSPRKWLKCKVLVLNVLHCEFIFCLGTC